MEQQGDEVSASPERGEVTALLCAWASGGPEVAERIFELVYSELRAIAANHFRRERVGQTLQPTALVHEAYLRLVDQTRVEWKNRGHFFAVASQAMRRALVDHARARAAAKRGRGLEPETLRVEVAAETPVSPIDVLALDQALDRLAAADAQLARVVELRFFGGLTLEETTEVAGRSLASVKRDWRAARAFLHRELGLLAERP
ncbi:MAG: ECF-type sigma factor [Thermoanaerobaculia bacterium]